MSINAEKDNFVKQLNKLTTATQHVTYDMTYLVYCVK